MINLSVGRGVAVGTKKVGNQRARELGFYMQKYCGCVFSEADRYQKQIDRDRAKFDAEEAARQG